MTASTGDLRLAIRGLRRSPLFAIVATLSLALGIGANTAIFTLMDQILLRTLPAKDPDRLVMLYQQGAHNGSNMGTRMHSYPVYQDLQRRAEPLAEVICRRLAPASVSIDNQTERVNAELVSGNYFSVLGVDAMLGRALTPEDDKPGAPPAAVMSYGYWKQQWKSDPQIVNKDLVKADFSNGHPIILGNDCFQVTRQVMDVTKNKLVLKVSFLPPAQPCFDYILDEMKQPVVKDTVNNFQMLQEVGNDKLNVQY